MGIVANTAISGIAGGVLPPAKVPDTDLTILERASDYDLTMVTILWRNISRGSQ